MLYIPAGGSCTSSGSVICSTCTSCLRARRCSQSRHISSEPAKSLIMKTRLRLLRSLARALRASPNRCCAVSAFAVAATGRRNCWLLCATCCLFNWLKPSSREYCCFCLPLLGRLFDLSMFIIGIPRGLSLLCLILSCCVGIMISASLLIFLLPNGREEAAANGFVNCSLGSPFDYRGGDDPTDCLAPPINLLSSLLSVLKVFD